MHEIECPHCGKVFQLEESSYAELLRQVRNQEFAREMNERQKLMDAEHARAVELAVSETRQEEHKRTLQAERERDALTVQLERQKDHDELARAELQRSYDKQLEERDRQIALLKQQATARESAHEAQLRHDAELAQIQAKENVAAQLAERDRRIAELEQQASAQTSAFETEKQLAVATAMGETERRLVSVESDLKQARAEKDQLEASYRARLAEREAYRDQQLRDKEAEIERLRNMRAQLSTKLVGETLEQHCEIQFNKLRATAFRNADFHKDNEIVGGTKGDYIYRELDDDGVEIVSIMFEMKNEELGSTHRHKNEDFFKKLDRDRHNKACEYAVLVSLLEPDNDFYNGGIADVSYAFDKMYVIRPQFFIPIITILRNAAMNALAARRELLEVRQQNIDITNFEAAMEEFKDRFGKNYATASRKFAAAIDEIDKTIDHLKKVKANLTSSQRQLRLANDKAEALSIRRLTRNNPTMKAKFAELADARQDEGDAAIDLVDE